MSTIKEQAGVLHGLLSEELATAVARNPELDRELIRDWVHQQLRQLENEGWQDLPSAPPIEPRGDEVHQDEMDALDEIWRKALARFKP